MASSFYDPALLTEHLEIALEELVQASGLTADEIVELVDYGVFQPLSGGAGGPQSASSWRFSARAIVLGRRARRLKIDFELTLPALSLVLSYLERIDEMEEELARLRAQLLR